MSSKTKSTETKSTETNRKNFIWFNGIIISNVVIFGILAKRAPYNILTIKSKTVLNVIFPLVYFTCFSFISGGLFIVGDDYLSNYIELFIPNHLLDVGFIAAYTGTIGLILSYFIKSILETIYGITITSTITLDLIGLVIGRIILLSVMYLYDLTKSSAK